MGALFDGVKERVTARDAAEMYIGLSRNGKALCPWHPDKHPSLSFDRRTGRCKCFSCNNGGSSIDLVMGVFGLSSLEAAKKINADFGLGLDSSPAPPPRGKSESQWRREFDEWFREEHKRLYHEKERLEKLAESFKPDELDNNPAFDDTIEALALRCIEIENLELMNIQPFKSASRTKP